MDRKAFARCAAATASLGALLSVGCGNGGAEPATSARSQARPASSPPAVVVSPEKEFFKPERYTAPAARPPAMEVANEHRPANNSSQPVDPWAAQTPATDSPASEAPVAEVVVDHAPMDDAAEEVVAAETSDETLAPVPAELTTESELKFSVAGTPAPAAEAAVETIKIAVQAPGEAAPSDESSATPSAPIKPQAASRYAAKDSKRELLPVLVTPRTAPILQPTTQSPGLAKSEPRRSAPETVAEQPPAEAEPTVAKVAPEAIQPESAIAKSEIENVEKAEPAPELRSTLVVKVEPVVVDAAAPLAKPEPAPIANAEPKPAQPVQVSENKTPAAAVAPETRSLARAEISPAPAAPADLVAAAPEAPVAEPAIPEAAAPVPPLPVAVAPAPVAAAPQAPVAVATQPAAAAPAAISPSVPLPQVAGMRSPAMVATLAQADGRVRHAIQLAEKGAMYASRKEFTAVLTMIAQAHDVERGTRQHSQAVSAGLLALKEAHDFVAPTSAEIDVVRLVAGHRTPVLKQLNVSDLPPTLAAQYYYSYAKEHLAAGVGRETVGSIALYGLAKILIAGAGHNAQQLEFTGPAIALYQAALISEPQNFRAAHELGVLLAGSGQLEMAREMLMGSVAQAPQPIMYQNLAVVHSRLGEPQLAREAQQKASTLEQTIPQTKAPPVQWVDPATFASLGTGTDATIPAQPPAARPVAAAAGESEKPAPSVARKRPTNWNPLNLRR